MSQGHLKQIEETATVLEWSEFHYHLFSHLISEQCPRELAKDVELACFPQGPTPTNDFMKLAVEAVALSEGPEDANERLVQLVELAKKAFPNHHWSSGAVTTKQEPNLKLLTVQFRFVLLQIDRLSRGEITLAQCLDMIKTTVNS